MDRTASSFPWIALALASGALGAAASLATGCPPHYTAEIAYGPPCFGFSGASGRGINDAGDIVGYAFVGCATERAFVWKVGMPTIQLLAMPAGTNESRAYAINNSGQIVGTFTKPGQGTHGFIMSGTTFTDMGTLPGGNWSEAYDVNDQGVAVGFWGNVVQGPSPLAMSWASGSMADLTSALGSPLNSKANALNESGALTGFVSERNLQYDARAFILTGRRLTVLPPVAGGYTSFGTAINGLGQIAGYGFVECDPPQEFCGYRHGFFWDGKQMIDLGTLPQFPRVRPYGLNNAGQIVGYMEDFNDNVGFLWQGGQLYVLNDLAGFDGQSIGMGFASAINEAGQITGDVTNANGNAVVRLTPARQRVTDLDCDGTVDSADLAILLDSWGMRGGPADLDANGIVDPFDLGILLGDWDV